MFGVHTEKNGLVVAAIVGAKIVGDDLGDQFGALFQNELAIIISGVVLPIRNFVALAIKLPVIRAETLGVFIQKNADNPIWGKKAVLNSLLQGVRINGFAEVIDIGDGFVLFGSGSQADLRGG